MATAATPSAALPGAPGLRANAAWSLVGNGVYAACQWGMLIVVAKLTSVESVGRFALGLALTAPIVMFANLQLRAIQATDMAGRYGFGQYLRVRLLTGALACVAIGAIVLLSGYKGETAWVILGIGGLKTVESMSDLLYGRMQQREDMYHIARSMMMRGLVALAVLLCVMLLTGELVAGIVAMIVSWAAVLVLHDIPAAAAGSAEVSTTHGHATIRELLYRALPLGAVMLLVSLNTNIPRYFLDSHLGHRSLGIFAAVASPLAAGMLVVAAIGQSASPRLARYAHDHAWGSFKRLLFQLIAGATVIGMLGLLVVLIAGEPILRIAFSAEFAAYQQIFLWLAVAAGLGYVGSFLGCAMTALHQFRIQVPLCLAVSATVALAAWYWVPRYGLLGAALATVAAALVQLVGLSTVLAWGLRQRIRSSHA